MVIVERYDAASPVSGFVAEVSAICRKAYRAIFRMQITISELGCEYFTLRMLVSALWQSFLRINPWSLWPHPKEDAI